MADPATELGKRDPGLLKLVLLYHVLNWAAWVVAVLMGSDTRNAAGFLAFIAPWGGLVVLVWYVKKVGRGNVTRTSIIIYLVGIGATAIINFILLISTAGCDGPQKLDHWIS
jgi:hypothetical protein